MRAYEFVKESKKSFSKLEDYDPNGPPPGPEFKPTMPKGTVRVDVSDVYDWYKLGQHISNLKGLGKHDFGKGPPSTILSFGDEDTEHEYIQDLEKTGLTTTDIDPIDPNQPKSMKRQKTDPTFNVNETDDRKAAVLKIQKHLNKKYGANLDLDGKLGPLTLKSINKFMPRAKTGFADEPNKTTAVQGKKLKEASGYIPSAKEKNDPRFKTALTVDVKPDAIKKNAKEFNWKTSRAGIPPQARADGKIAEDLMREFKTFLGEQQEKRIHMINQEFDGASLEGYVVDTDQVQLENYLESQGANPQIAKKLAQQYNRIGIIRNMWVDEEERGQGLGTDLVSNAIDDAYLNDAEAIVLVSDEGESNEFNLTKWYESFGFKKIGMAGSDPIMLLSKSLNEADD